MTNRIHRPLALVAGASTAAVVLLALDGGVLAAPRTWSVDGWTELVDARGPAAAAMTMLRYVALAASAYLALLGLASAVVRALHLRWLDALVTIVTPRVLRPMLGIVTVATFAAPHAAGASDTVSAPPVMVLVGSTDARTITSTTTTTTGAAPTMRRVAPPPTTSAVTTVPPTTTSVPPTIAPTTIAPAVAAPTTTVTMTMPPVVSAPAAKAPTLAPPTPAATPTWTIRRGEHLWHVAETVLTERLGRTPSTAETTAYWRKVISTNRERLVDPDNPDLVFADQVFALPPA